MDTAASTDRSAGSVTLPTSFSATFIFIGDGIGQPTLMPAADWNSAIVYFLVAPPLTRLIESSTNAR